MANYIRFFDEYQAAPIQVTDSVKDYYANLQPGQNIRPLQVKFAATHAGKVTRNNGLYLPHEMRAAVPSWTDQYAKPILLHHEDHDDPIGRVVSARYVDISVGIRNSYDKRSIVDSLRIGPKLLEALVSGTLSFRESVDVVTRYLISDNSLIDDPDYEGLGFIELTTQISDPDAIQKFLDGRYQTGSVGATTNKALCSICKKDWAGDDGRCEHRPGATYEGKKAVLIAGKLSYDEYSVVNKPADKHSRAIEININGIQDFVQLDAETNGVILDHSIPGVTFLIDSVEEGNMPDEVKEQVTDSQLPVADSIEVLDAKVPEVVLPVVEVQVETVETVETVKTEEVVVTDQTSELDPVQDFWGEEYNLLVGDGLWDREYAEMMADAIQAETDPAKQAILRDAKLSSEKRKSLSASTFCGPDRSFPVPDCAHVVAARRLIGKYKGPGDKTKILACVSRKAARLGCDSKSKDEVGFGTFDIAYFDSFEDVELLQLANGIQAAMKERSLLDEVVQEVVQEDAQLVATQTELKVVNDDLTLLQDRYADTLVQLRREKENRICLLESITKPDFSVETRQATFLDMSLEDIEKILTDVEKVVDLTQVRSILTNDATVSQPPIIDDPTLKIDNTKVADEAGDQQRARIMREYLQIRRVNRNQAEVFLNEMHAKGLIKG
jgi:hypothetical protein